MSVLYFAFASNMVTAQMAERCPSAERTSPAKREMGAHPMWRARAFRQRLAVQRKTAKLKRQASVGVKRVCHSTGGASGVML